MNNRRELIHVVVLVIWTAICFLGMAFLLSLSSGCSSVQPTHQFNSEDTQDGSCYATMGGMRGYCNAIDEDVTDVFCNTCFYNEEIE